MATRWRELARAANSGASAVLFWDESSGRIRIALADEQLCQFVDVQIRTEAQLTALCSPLGGESAGTREKT